MTEPTPEQLAAGQPKGLTPEMCVFLRGENPEELGTSADAFLSLLATQTPPPAPRSGGTRGTDVNAPQGVAAGAEAYRRKHGLDDEGRRPEALPLPTSGRNPFQTTTYEMER
ncbi:hypothetical protein [Streptomyces sp. NPDC047869]|uniref:hypothetical protein n=1 Tax=Streptomyces sp. NPDC047869 TaxID=3154709 RepID=UPI003454BBA9